MLTKWEKVGKVLINNFMLIGEYIHTIDEKNRISLPVKFRKEMGKKIIITPGLDQCLFIFTIKEWAKVSKRLSDTDSETLGLTEGDTDSEATAPNSKLTALPEGAVYTSSAKSTALPNGGV